MPYGHGVAVGGVLKRSRELVRPALVEAVGRLHPWTGEMAAYALGWSDASGTPGRGGSEGKGVRQALAVLGAEAVGADGGVAVAGAVAVELVHTFSLMHDDIMDGDGLRRQRPAVWKAYGTGPAVLAGDAIHALAVQCLAEAPGPFTGDAVRRLCGTLNALVSGQAEDLRFERHPWSGTGAVGPDQYRSMAEDKTGALLGCAIALGATLGGAPSATVAVLERAGRQLGVAFQVVDDLLGIWGDPAVTGKPVHGDLRLRKKTYPVLAALAGTGAAARELAVLLDSPEPFDSATATRAAALVEEAGGRAATREEARRHLDAARHGLREVPLAPGAAADLDALFAYLLDRSW
ncbi:polyprenyl synthetase family protein [Streptomyces sp. NBC_01619]|uniref:Polyprenyl synthetase family protein n=1 Tax=Streptomyces pratisoli TaxID=3139917 RepID=A0ACC6Q9Z8_9ACTN|nr:MULTISPECIES: polyprenyl synthetase family protein [unclassified Streptomyces]MCX4511166.1 polyprenyl synthetase family protein [Streptomyces sp. NBC_01619]